MRPLAPFSVLAVLALAPAAPAQDDDRPARKATDDELQQKINDAVFRGMEHLRRSQAEDGRWVYDQLTRHAAAPELQEHFDGGLTALALYGLAASGEPADSETIEKGVAWQDAHDLAFSDEGAKGTYCASLLILALTRIDASAHRSRIRELARRLVSAQRPDGMWSYRLARYRKVDDELTSFTRGDHSNTQFAVLGLWAAEESIGFRTPRRTWIRVANHFKRAQRDNGAWSYLAPGVNAPDRISPRMTAVGLVSYICAKAALARGRESLPDLKQDKVVTRGLTYFLSQQKEWDLANYYAVYAIERVGTYCSLPDHAWYPEIAATLVERQSDAGVWDPVLAGTTWGHGDSQHVYETAMALLFLSKASVTPITPRRK